MRHLAVWVLGAVALRVVVVPAEHCPPVDAAQVRRSLDAAAGWLTSGQRRDGRYRYGYDRANGRVSGAYNSTRHAGVLDVLYRLGRVEAADAGLAYVLRNLVHGDGWTAFAPPGEDVNAGANALVAAALVHRREATGDRRHDTLARRIGRFLAGQVEADGRVLKYWSRATGRPVPGVVGKFSTGETMWALALLGRDGPAHRVARYLALERDDAEGHAIRQPDHWAAQGLAELDRLTGVEIAYARRLAGYFGFETRLLAQGRLVPNSGASIGTIGEATAALWRLAGREHRLADVRDDLRERLRCLAGILVDRQAREGGALVRGAWFDDAYTQMDDQQHAASALLGALAALP